MLYASEPTLPGSDEVEVADLRGADTGAMMWQNLPYAFVQSRALAHGELPLWNRYNSSGTVLLGQGLSMFGDPLHLVVLAGGGALISEMCAKIEMEVRIPVRIANNPLTAIALGGEKVLSDPDLLDKIQLEV